MKQKIPLIWWAWSCGKRMKEEYRLHEEHLHKWTVARTFEGLSKRAKELDTDSNVQGETSLFQEIIKAYAMNPSEVIDVKAPFPMMKVANFLRKLSSDQLDQLINALKTIKNQPM